MKMHISDVLNANKENEPDNTNYTSNSSVSCAPQIRHENCETPSVDSHTNYEIVNKNKLTTSKLTKIHEEKAQENSTQDGRNSVKIQTSCEKPTDQESNFPKQLKINVIRNYTKYYCNSSV